MVDSILQGGFDNSYTLFEVSLFLKPVAIAESGNKQATIA